jgi:hypothetical protein
LERTGIGMDRLLTSKQRQFRIPQKTQALRYVGYTSLYRSLHWRELKSACQQRPNSTSSASRRPEPSARDTIGGEDASLFAFQRDSMFPFRHAMRMGSKRLPLRN